MLSMVVLRLLIVVLREQRGWIFFRKWVCFAGTLKRFAEWCLQALSNGRVFVADVEHAGTRRSYFFHY